MYCPILAAMLKNKKTNINNERFRVVFVSWKPSTSFLVTRIFKYICFYIRSLRGGRYNVLAPVLTELVVMSCGHKA